MGLDFPSFFFFFKPLFAWKCLLAAPPSPAVCVGQRQQDPCCFYGDGSLTSEGGAGSAAGSCPCRTPHQPHASFDFGTGVYKKRKKKKERKGKKGNNNPVIFFLRCSMFKYYLHPDSKCFSFIYVCFPGREFCFSVCFYMNFRH